MKIDAVFALILLSQIYTCLYRDSELQAITGGGLASVGKRGKPIGTTDDVDFPFQLLETLLHFVSAVRYPDLVSTFSPIAAIISE